MSVLNTRAIYFPYCLHQLDDKSWIVLNRNYKPLGSGPAAFADFEDVDPEIRIAKITPNQARLLSFLGETNAEGRIYLYDGDGIPNARGMAGYLKRLSVLMKLKPVQARKAFPRKKA
jgi:hypothetical protein